jgi:hypothetical protein
MLYDVCLSVWQKHKKTCLRCYCLKGFIIAIVKTEVWRYNELRSELVYKIELLQQAGLGAGTKWVKPLIVMSRFPFCRNMAIALTPPTCWSWWRTGRVLSEATITRSWSNRRSICTKTTWRSSSSEWGTMLGHIRAHAMQYNTLYRRCTWVVPECTFIAAQLSFMHKTEP